MATPEFGQREDLYRVTVIVTGTDGQKFKFTFDSFDGGDSTSKETKYRPGNGTIDEISLGGATSISNITVKVLQTYAVYQWVTWLMQQNGKADMSVNKQPLDINGSPYGKPLAYGGRLSTVTPPKADASSEAAGVLSLMQSTVGPVTTG